MNMITYTSLMMNQYPGGTCPVGTHYCPTTGTCIALGGTCPPPPPGPPLPPNGYCPVGTKWCEPLRSCVPIIGGACPPAPTPAPAPGPPNGYCPVGTKWCETTRSCVPIIGGSCPPAPTPAPAPSPPNGYCPVGTKWCETTRSCVPIIGGFCPPHATGLCPMGTKYCDTTRSCLAPDALCPAVNPSPAPSPATGFCASDEKYCVTTRSCLPQNALCPAVNPTPVTPNACAFSTPFVCSPGQERALADVSALSLHGPQVACLLSATPGTTGCGVMTTGECGLRGGVPQPGVSCPGDGTPQWGWQGPQGPIGYSTTGRVIPESAAVFTDSTPATFSYSASARMQPYFKAKPFFHGKPVFRALPHEESAMTCTVVSAPGAEPVLKCEPVLRNRAPVLGASY